MLIGISRFIWLMNVEILFDGLKRRSRHEVEQPIWNGPAHSLLPGGSLTPWVY